jgi:cytidine deaminase
MYLQARKLSYSPYSKFRVGAAILCKNDEIILGANIENASYGGAICAERTALVKGMTSGQSSGSFIAIAVSAGECSRKRSSKYKAIADRSSFQS